MNVGKMIMGGAIGLILGTGVLHGKILKISNITKNNDSKIEELSVSKIDTIQFVRFGRDKKDLVLATITQSRPCLYLDEQAEEDFVKVDTHTFKMRVFTTYQGSVIYRKTHGEYIKQFMGLKNCSMVGVVEEWAVSARIDGKWGKPKYIKVKWVK